MKALDVLTNALNRQIEYLEEVVDPNDKSTYLPDVTNRQELEMVKELKENLCSSTGWNVVQVAMQHMEEHLIDVQEDAIRGEDEADWTTEIAFATQINKIIK